MLSKIIIIDDDPFMLETLKEGLSEFFDVTTFERTRPAKEYLKQFPTDAIVMDYHIAGEDMFESYQDLRGSKTHPIVFLTGDACPKLKIKGLDLGVDDFLHKPISVPELEAHLRNRIRSYGKKKTASIVLENLEVNLQNPSVKVNGAVVTLTKKEFQILAILVQNANSVVKKSQMLDEIWANVTVEVNNLDTHLSNLRRKLVGFTGHIKTMKCFGYSLRVRV